MWVEKFTRHMLDLYDCVDYDVFIFHEYEQTKTYLILFYEMNVYLNMLLALLHLYSDKKYICRKVQTGFLTQAVGSVTVGAS